MRCFRQVILGAVLISVAFTFGFGSQKADAGACNDLGLANKCVEACDIGVGAVGSGKVKNNSLRAVDLQDEPGADFADGDQFQALPTTDTVFRSVTITAPRPGVVIVNATGTLFDSTNPSRVRGGITTATLLRITTRSLQTHLASKLLPSLGQGALRWRWVQPPSTSCARRLLVLKRILSIQA